ncbi:MAG: histidine kinase [Mariniphaga sp.]|nr:histidine kinase [Mariniphaga sp.]
MQTGRENIFVVPDKNLFHLINTGINGFTSFYMGPGASISLRSNLIDEWSKDYNIQNRVNELNKDEFLNLIFKADFLELEKIKNPIFKNMKQKHEMFFIPRRSVRYLELGRSVVIGVDSFWISNEVTNKEYRKFAMDIINNPDQVLKWEEAGRNPTTGIYERNIELELYSEISKHLVDSTCVVNILYKGEELEIGIDEYLNGKKFNDYPVLGIPIEGVEYYIKWLNQKYLPTDGFLYRLPGEMDYRIVKDYVNEVYNYKETKSDFHGVIKAPDDTLAFLFANAPEWTLKSKVFRDPTDRENKNIVIGDWSEQGDSIVATNDGIESGGFRLIRRARELGKRKSDHTQIFIALFVLFVIILIGVLIWRVRIKWNLNKEIRLRRVRELELTAIRSQMNPHFLFNSLNSVQNLIQQNKGREAHLYLSDFAGLIRKVLRNSEKEEVSIAEELEMVEQYLNLEKLRFDFEFTILVGEGIDAQNTMIPSMLLQPFAENAVIHGLQNKPSDRKLKIEVLKTEGGIIIVLEDNGIGREEARKVAAEKNGKGIKMNKERMELLREKYGEKYRLEIIDLERGTKVEIIIPEEN